MPPLPGAAVAGPRARARPGAVLRSDGGQAPDRVARDGEPLYLNLEFLDGTRGAHVNISGISGVATKTTTPRSSSTRLFNSGVLGAEAINTKALIFNVKGEDLLFLDHANIRLADKDRERYRRMGLEPNPFDSVAVYGRPARSIKSSPTSPPAPSAPTPTTGPSPSSSSRSSWRSCSPTPRTSASSTRW